MNALKRNLMLSVLIGAALVCGAATAVNFQHNAAQQNRNAALIAAINDNSPLEALRLLANGADANARELPPDTRTFWEKLREIARPVKRDEAAYPSAVTLALRQILSGNNSDAQGYRLNLLKALHDAGAVEEGWLAPSQEELKRAEGSLAQDADGGRSSLGPLSYLSETEAQLIGFLSKKGMSARAMTDLAECWFEQENYAGAAQACRIAALWQTPDAAQQTRLAQAEEYERAAAAIRRTLPASQSLLWVRPYPSASRPAAWLAQYSGQNAEGFEEAQMAYYQSDGAGLRQICHTPSGRSQLWLQRNTSNFRLRILPLPKLAAPAIFLFHSEPLSGNRACLSVFACERGKFTELASMSHDEEITVEKARRGGGYVIRRQYRTGESNLPEPAPPRSDYYAFNGRRFVLADAQYPETCRAYIEAAEAALRKKPGDYDLRQSLAAMYKIAGLPQKAEQNYRRAESDCRAAIAKSGVGGYTADGVLLEQILARDPERHF